MTAELPLRTLAEREFDAAWYQTTYPDVARSVAQGLFADGLDHYVRTGHTEGRSPSAYFDEEFYLEAYPDVARAVGERSLACGFQHFLLHGRSEGRLPRRPEDITCTVDSVNGNLLDGWAANLASPAEIVELEFYLDDRLPIGRVLADLPRRDLASVLPVTDHGFVFRVPLVYADGTRHRITVREVRGRRMSLRTGRGGQFIDAIDFAYRFDQGLSAAIQASRRLDEIAARLEELRGEIQFVKHLASIPLAEYDHYYGHFCVLSGAELASLALASSRLVWQPRFSVVLPVYDPNPSYLDEAIWSVRNQAYPGWELCISDDASTDEGVREVIRAHARSDRRVRFVSSEHNGGVARNTNRALSLATGDYVAFLDHDDLLTPDALYVMALALQERRSQILYSDEDIIDESGAHVRVHLKPDFNYDYFLAVNYLCHLVVIERSLLDRIGGLREGFDGCQDRDLLLRAVETCGRENVLHVPKVLYHWRLNPGSISNTDGRRQPILQRSIECVQQHLDRTKSGASAMLGSPQLYSTRVRWPVPQPPPLVTIVIPSRDRLDLLAPCLTSILERTAYKSVEIVGVDHDSTEAATGSYLEIVGQDPRVRVSRFSGAFNWSALNNFGASDARGGVLCFLNNDTLVFDPTWLEELVTHASRDGVGAVSGKLLYENGTVQHAGVVLGVGGFAGHAFQRLLPTEGGYMGRAACVQEVSAVTGACLVCRTEVFREMGGFDPAFEVALNDVDFCLRLAEAGYRVVWSPHSLLYHFESRSRGYDDANPEKAARLARESVRLRQRWGDTLTQDPHYNPHFDLSSAPYERLLPQKRVWTAEDLPRARQRKGIRREARGPGDARAEGELQLEAGSSEPDKVPSRL